ncbi:MAG: DUF5777 family beta-barrel protein [Crocinitomicaceae bacterium]|nr:DUF5777 family beta-barrel protein [Crocinitomicaceae bacterium]
MMKKVLILCSLALAFGANAQNVEETFTGTRVINGHSVETLKKRILEFRIEHRFGDIAGAQGGVQQFFGFDQAADIRFAFEYGISDNWMIGVGRSKGTGAPYSSLVDGFTKYRFLTQQKDGTPLSLAVMGSAMITYATASADLTQVTSYPKFSHRMAYSAQVIAARKFGEHFSAQIMPTFVHRNLVDIDDVNSLFSLGGALNYKINKNYGLIVEYYHNFNPSGFREDMKNSLGVAFEWTTNGHNFKMNFTNSRGFGETQFIPYTTSDWLAGEFRFGFSISRKFKL